MSGPYRQGVADWVAVRIEGADGIGVTGLVYNSAGLSCKLAKAGAAAATKTLANGELVEQGNGFYWVRLTAGDLDTTGPGVLVVIYQTIEMAIPFRVSGASADSLAATLALIKAKTDALPASPANETTLTTMATALLQLMQLGAENSVRDELEYEAGDLVSARVRFYDSAAHATAAGAEGLLFTLAVAATYSAPGVLETYRVTVVP